MRRIALYGGTFDPVHTGHLIGARDALEQGRLDAVIWVPCMRSLRKGPPQTPAKHRWEMVRRAIAGIEGFAASDFELDKPSCPAIETALAFRAAAPRAELFWIIGGDHVATLSKWHRYPELRKIVTFMVLDRPGAARAPKRKGLIFLPQPRAIDISSTEIRARVKAGRSIDFLVPAPVARYIARHQLYRSP